MNEEEKTDKEKVIEEEKRDEMKMDEKTWL